MSPHDETPGPDETSDGPDTEPLEQVEAEQPDQDSEPSLNAPEEGRPDGTVAQ